MKRAIVWPLKIYIWNIIMEITKQFRYCHERTYNIEHCAE
jgi:hypothetical protein